MKHQIIAILILISSSFLFSQVPYKNEFLVNTSQTGLNQRDPQVGVAGNGDFVVAFQSAVQPPDSNGTGIFVDLFYADGTKNGSAIGVNSEYSLDQQNPSLAVNKDGSFVVTWESELQEGASLGFDIYGQLFDSDGSKIGNEFHVNTYDTLDQVNSVVDMDTSGNFVVAWESNGQDPDSLSEVYAQMFDKDGNKIGSEFKVNTNTNANTGTRQRLPAIDVRADGSFIIAWHSWLLDGSLYGTYAQIFDASGNPVGSEFQVNTSTFESQAHPRIDSDLDGNFTIVWESGHPGAANERDIFGQRYNSSGVAIGSEFLINTYRLDYQNRPDITMDDNGYFTVVWYSADQDGDLKGVFGQRYDSAGQKLGSEFQVNTYTLADQEFPSVSGVDRGNFVVVWESWNQDGGLDGIYGQMYKMSPAISSFPAIAKDEDLDKKVAVTSLFPYVTDENDGDASLTWQFFNGTNVSASFLNDTLTLSSTSDWYGTDSIQVVVTDPGGLTGMAYQTINVSNVNDSPVVSDILDQTIDEGATFNTISLDNFISDIDNPDSVITWTYSGNSELTVTITNRVPTISIPDLDWYGEETITFIGTDPGGLADSNEATFTVNPVNDNPVVSGIPNKTILEGNTFATFDLDDYVTDVDNTIDQLSWSSSGETDLGIAIDETTHVVTISIPDIDWFGSETITFTATDPDNATGSDDAVFTVTNVNDAPVVSDIPGETIDEGTTFMTIDLDDYVNDVDNSDAQLNWIYSGQTNLSVDIDEASHVATITTPNDDWFGAETITFTATDPGDSSDSDNATFTVTAVNDAPIVSVISNQTIDEGFAFETISLDNFVSDVDNNDNQMTWSYSGNSELSVAVNGSRVATISIPDVNWNGSETITLKATDPGGLADSVDVVFTVSPVNDSPIVSDIPNQEIDEGSTFMTINLDDYVSDADNDVSQINWIYSGNNELSVSISPARVATITIPNINWNGAEEITFEASDPSGASDSDPATFTVNAVNDAPVVSNIPGQSIAEGQSFTSINLSNYVSDVDNSKDQITWSYSGNGELIVNITDSIATVSTPNVNWNGNETITFTATDPGDESDSDDAAFNVSSENDPPIVSDIGNQTIQEGQTFTTISLDGFVADADHADNQITWTSSGEEELTVTIDQNRVATITIPNENWNGSETITFAAEDPDGLSNSDDAVFTVNAVNDAPVVSDIPAQTIAEGESFTNISLDTYVYDVDNADNTMTWSFSGNTDLSVVINETSRVATITAPDANWNGTEIITFTATDPGDLFDSDTVAFTVQSVNDAPVVSDIDDQTIDEGNTFTTITLDDFVDDLDNEDSEIVWGASGTSELVVTIDENRIATITLPSENWNGAETITFTATDPGELADSDTARFTVNAVNDAPVASAIADQSIAEGGTFPNINLDSFVTDVDNGDSEITWTYSGNSNLVVEVDTNRVLHVMPDNKDWFGSETIILTATDPGALSDKDTVLFTVTPVNDAPVIGELPEEVTFFNDSTVTIPLAGLATDIDSPEGSLVWSFETNLENDSLTVIYNSEMNTATISVLPGFTGDVEIYGTVTDDSSASDTDTILVHVEAVVSAIDDMFSNIPTKYELHQNFPNPFNPSTKIRFGLPKAGSLKLEVYNIIGQKVATLYDGFKAAGYHVIEYDASYLASGIYFYRIEAGRYTSIKKMILIK